MRRLTLSAAILAGADTVRGSARTGYLTRRPGGEIDGTDILGAAFIGALVLNKEYSRFAALAKNLSDESMPGFIEHGLMKQFPHLGRSVRDFPALHKFLRGEGKTASMLACGRYRSGPYSLVIHRSLYGVLARLSTDTRLARTEAAAILHGFAL